MSPDDVWEGEHHLWGDRFINGKSQKDWDKTAEEIKKDLAAREARQRAEEAARQEKIKKMKDELGE